MKQLVLLFLIFAHYLEAMHGVRSVMNISAIRNISQNKITKPSAHVPIQSCRLSTTVVIPVVVPVQLNDTNDRFNLQQIKIEKLGMDIKKLHKTYEGKSEKYTKDLENLFLLHKGLIKDQINDQIVSKKLNIFLSGYYSIYFGLLETFIWNVAPRPLDSVGLFLSGTCGVVGLIFATGAICSYKSYKSAKNFAQLFENKLNYSSLQNVEHNEISKIVFKQSEALIQEQKNNSAVDKDLADELLKDFNQDLAYLEPSEGITPVTNS